MALRPGELGKLLHGAIQPFFDPTLDQRYEAANPMPDDMQNWFKALPAYTAAVEAITPLRGAAIEAVEALNDAAEDHVVAVRQAVHEAEDAPRPDLIEITPEITIEPPEPMFHTLDDFLTATRKLIARRDGSEGGANEENEGSDAG